MAMLHVTTLVISVWEASCRMLKMELLGLSARFGDVSA